MCDSCPDCPECGQMVPEPAGPNYFAGLLLPPILMLWVSYTAHYYGYIDTFVYGLLVGVASLGAVMLVRTDPHPFQLRR